jgi:hypothetical protein
MREVVGSIPTATTMFLLPFASLPLVLVNLHLQLTPESPPNVALHTLFEADRHALNRARACWSAWDRKRPAGKIPRGKCGAWRKCSD